MKLILKPTSQEPDVRLIAQIHHWQLVHDIAPASGRPRQLIWTTPAGDASITYVEDDLLNTRYLQLRGPERELSQQLRDGLEIVSRTDLQGLKRPELDTATAIQLVHAAVLMASEGPFDAEIFALLTGAFHHQDVAVRRAAIFAITYLPWQRFRDELMQMVERDQTVAPDIQAVVSSLDRNGWK